MRTLCPTPTPSTFSSSMRDRRYDGDENGEGKLTDDGSDG